MTKSKLIEALQKKFPGIEGIQDGDDWGAEHSIHLGNAAEGGEVFITMDGETFGLPAADYYAEFGGSYDNEFAYGVHEDLAAFLDKHGWYTEWHDPGTLLAYRQ